VLRNPRAVSVRQLNHCLKSPRPPVEPGIRSPAGRNGPVRMAGYPSASTVNCTTRGRRSRLFS